MFRLNDSAWYRNPMCWAIVAGWGLATYAISLAVLLLAAPPSFLDSVARLLRMV